MDTKIFKIITDKIISVTFILLIFLLNGGLKQPDPIEIPSFEEETTQIERAQTPDQDEYQRVPWLNLTGTPVTMEATLDLTLFT